jgi:hypothetical protein
VTSRRRRRIDANAAEFKELRLVIGEGVFAWLSQYPGPWRYPTDMGQANYA